MSQKINRNIQAIYPLTPLQAGFVFHSLAEEDNQSYVNQFIYKIDPETSEKRLENAWKLVIQRYEALRTLFIHQKMEQPIQVILKDRDFSLRSSEASQSIDDYVRLVAREERKEGFDLSRDLLLRIHLVHDDQQKFMVFTFHHIILDGWSVPIVFQQLEEYYKQLGTCSYEDLKEQILQEMDSARAYSEYLSHMADLDRQPSQAYWAEQLKDIQTNAQLANLTPVQADHLPKQEKLTICQEDFERIRAWADDQGITMSTLVEGLLSLLSFSESSNQEVIFGKTVSGRNLPLDGIEDMVGLFINTLPVVARLDEEASFAGFVQSLQQQANESLEHSFDSLAQLQKLSPLGKDLFSFIYVFENIEVAEDDTGEWSPETIEAVDQTNYDFSVSAYTDDSLNFNLFYYSDKFSQADIRRFMDKLRAMAGCLAKDGQASNLDLLLARTEKDQELLEAMAAKPVPKEAVDFVACFKKSLRMNPQADCLMDKQRSLTYEEVDRASDGVAKLLVDKGISSGDVVGLDLNKDAIYFVALLGVIKAGAAFVTLDRSLPAQRLTYIREDARPKWILTDLEGEADNRLSLPNLAELMNQGSFKSRAQAGDPMYIIYTSGSTGRPKGVQVSHGAFSGLRHHIEEELEIGPEDRILQFANLSFDASLWDFCLAMVSGASLLVAAEAEMADAGLMEDLIQGRQATVATFPPHYLSQLNEKRLTSLRLIMTAGSAASLPLVEKYSRGRTYINQYGPTEAAISSTYWKKSAEEPLGKTIPIGRPIKNKRVYVTRRGQLCGIGVPGELAVGGDGFATGYLNQAAMTEEKFKHGRHGEDTLYFTGDLCRFLPDGQLEFLGRVDDQVKLRGYRIELGEIEAVIRGQTGVENAAVVLRNKGEDAWIDAYYVGTISEPKVEEALVLQLPNYMIPRNIMKIAAIPLNASGKVDQKALPEAEIATMGTTPLQTEEEKVLGQVFVEVLGQKGLGLESDFYLLGGDSIKAISIVSKLRDHGYDLAVKDLLTYRTLGATAKKLRAKKRSQYSQEPWQGTVLPGPAMKLFLNKWKLAQPDHFNQSMVLLLQEEVTLAKIERALQELVHHHDMLRLRYQNGDLRIASEKEGGFFQLAVNQDPAALEDDATDLQKSLSLAGAKLGVLKFENEGQLALLICVHHLVMDHVSWGILLEDLKNLLNNGSLAEKTASYPVWQETLSKFYKENGEDEGKYWARVQAKLELPDPKVVDAGQVQLELSLEDSDWLLKESSRVYDTSVEEILLAALISCVGQNLSLSMESHGRDDRVDLSRTIGWFTSVYPVNFTYCEDLEELILSVREEVRGVPDSGIGYGWLTDSMDLPPLTFNYLGSTDNAASDVQLGMGEESDEDNILPYDQTLNIMVDQGRVIILSNQEQNQNQYVDPLAFKEKLVQVISFLQDQKVIQEALSGVEAVETSISDQMKIIESYGTKGHQVQGIYPPTPLQQGMIFHKVLEEEAEFYFEQGLLTVTGDICEEALAGAFQALTQKHEVLRSQVVYKLINQPRFLILAENSDWQVLKPAQGEKREDYLQEVIAKDRAKGFSLEEDMLFRGRMLRLSDSEVRVVLSFHHLIIDGWSIGILLQDFRSFYDRLSQGMPLANLLEAIKRDQSGETGYSDYLKLMAARNDMAAEEYWRKLVENVDQVTEIDDLEVSRKTGYMDHDLVFSLEETKAIKEYLTEKGTTASNLFESALAMVLRRYLFGDDICFGKVVSGRNVDLEKVTDLIGLFINTIPVVHRIPLETSLHEVLRQVTEQALNTREHDYYSLADIQSYSNLNHNLVKILYSFENYLVVEDSMAGDDSVIMDYETLHEKANVAMSVMAFEGESYFLRCQYDQARFHEAQVSNLLEQVRLVSLAMVADDGQVLKDLNLLTEADHAQIQGLNQTEELIDLRMNAPKALAEIARKQGEKTALVNLDEVWTYQELSRRVDSVAAELLRRGCRKGDIVAVNLEKGPDFIAAIYGVMKAGAIYVPLDRDMPIKRLDYILDNADPRFIISHSAMGRQDLSRRILVDQLEETNRTVWPDIAPSDGAYIIYTSGSTGRPKGVVVEHEGIINLAKHGQMTYGISAQDRLLQFANFIFDATVWELHLALLNGASLAIVPYEESKDVRWVQDYIQEKQVTLAAFPPNYLIQMDEEALDSLRLVVTAGSATDCDIVEKYGARRVYVNEYGPTENTCSATTWIHQPGSPLPQRIPIGRPIVNKKIYLIKDDQLCGLGMTGEIVIGGVGIAREYLHDKEKTDRAFRKNPFGPGQVYHTGDYGRLLPDGNIEFMGRQDDQVKIRGYRIELGGIESVLRTAELILDAHIKIQEEGDNKYLVAFVLAKGNVSEDKVKAELRRQLPEYMIPNRIVQLEKFPVNTSGKVDNKQLPWVEITGSSQYQPPVTQMEKDLVEAFQAVLAKDGVGINDHFFELGGHSLRATKLINHIEEKIGYRPPMKYIFEYPVVKELAARLESEKGENKEFSRIEDREYYPLSPAQKRMYQVQSMMGPGRVWNMPLHLAFQGILEAERLELAIKELIRRHQSLRTSFHLVEEEIYQRIEEVPDLPLEFIQDQGRSLEAVYDDFVRPFDLAQAPLIRFGLLYLDGNSHLFIDAHHIIFDGESLSTLLAELGQLYDGEKLTEPEWRYVDYCHWQGQVNYDEAARFWQNQFYDGVPILNLPLDFARSREKQMKGALLHTAFDEDLTEKLEQLAGELKTTEFSLLLSAWYLLLRRFSRQEDIVVGVPVSGRVRASLEGMVGMFVNTIPLRAKPHGDLPVREFIQQVSDLTMTTLEYQDYPYENIIEDLDLVRDFSRNPIFDVLFVLQNSDFSEEIFRDHKSLDSLQPTYSNAKYDLSLSLVKGDGSYGAVIEYDADLFRKETVEQMMAQYERILRSMVEEVSLTIADQPILDEESLSRVLALGTGEEVELTDGDLKQAFERVVEEFGHREAVKDPQQSLTYYQLNERANQLAHSLKKAGLDKGDILGLHLVKSMDFVVAVIASIKAGAAFLSLDPNLPEARLQAIVEEAQLKLMVSLAPVSWTEIPTLTMAQAGREPLLGNPETSLAPDDLAYLIYTSGTTGKPKGVLLEHEGVLNLLTFFRKHHGMTYQDRVLQFSSTNFDAIISEFVMSLFNGACLYVIPQDFQTDSEKLARIIQEEQISAVVLPPQLSHLLPLENLRKVITAGSASDAKLVERFKDLGNYANDYGPSEVTVCATSWLAQDLSDGQSVPIGLPIINKTVRILQDGQLCSPGMPGEICIGGLGLARGYLNRPELTQEKFISSPYHGERLYRSGDLGRCLPNGQIEFLGRMDKQIKLRGYRIELGEIEAVMKSHGDVREAVAVLKEEESGPYIGVYYLGEAQEEDLRLLLEEQLPIYMIPRNMMRLEEIPLNQSGKVDLAALPEFPDREVNLTQPSTVEEEAVADMFRQILKVDRVGKESDFFQLGGDSIKAIRGLSHLRQSGYVLDVRTIMSHKTVQRIARQLSREATKEYSQAEVTGIVKYGPMMERYFEWNLAKANHFNQAMIFDVDESFTKAELDRRIYALAGHHDMLRGLPVAGGLLIRPSQIEDLYCYRQLVTDQRTELEAAANQLHASLDLASCLMGVLDFTYQGRRHILWTIHHLLVDAISWQILGEDWDRLERGEALPAKTCSYGDYQAAIASPGEEEREFWQQMEEDLQPARSITGTIVTAEGSLPGAISNQLLQVTSEKLACSAQETILAALIQGLGHDETLAMESHGRALDEDLSRSVGWFTAVYPLKLEWQADLMEQLVAVKERVRQVPDQGVRYGQIRRKGYEPRVNFNWFGKLDQSDSDLPVGEAVSSENYLPQELSINGFQDRQGAIHLVARYVQGDDNFNGADILEKTLNELKRFAGLDELSQVQTASDIGAQGLSADLLEELSELTEELF